MAIATKKPRRTRPLVLGFLERVSSKVFEDYAQQITELVGRQQGVYALYKGDRLYYVGLATNLRNRVKQHRRDRHKGKWNKFSIYLVRKSEHIKELESLVLRIADPDGNAVKGRLAHAHNLKASLKKKMLSAKWKEIDKVLGARPAKRTRGSSKRVKKKKRAAGQASKADKTHPALKGHRAFTLKGTNKGTTYKARVHKDGTVHFDGRQFWSPSGAAKAALGRSVNGWIFWKYRNPSGSWVRLRELKR